MRWFSKRPVVSPHVVLLDIGTSKTCCWVVSQNFSNQFEVMGMGYQASHGYANGIVQDMEKLEHSITQVIDEAEKSCDILIRKVILSLNGSAFRSEILNLETLVENRMITNEDIHRLWNQAYTVKHSESHEPIHFLPLHYTLDTQEGIKNCVGMVGQKLSAHVHVVSAFFPVLQNILLCLKKCHLNVEGLVMASYASGLACLTKDEKKLGVTLFDIGGGGTSIASFWENQCVYTGYTPFGGDNITADLAYGLETSLEYAERLKILHGSSFPSEADIRVMVPIETANDSGRERFSNRVPRSLLIEIIQPRLEEILRKAYATVSEAGFDGLITQRIVITGGTSQMTGLWELASHTLGKSIRLGTTPPILGIPDEKRPDLATIYGLLQYTQTKEYQFFKKKPRKKPTTFYGQIFSWLRENL